MAETINVYVGTVGQGIWRSADGGETWTRSTGELYSESDIRAIAAHPGTPRILYAGSEKGCYRTEDGGVGWTHLPSPMDGTAIWALAVHPAHPDTLFAGARPSALYRSDDAGKSWTRLNASIETSCPPIIHTRITTILIDPMDERVIWAGVEIDGVYRSMDGGQTWTGHKEGLNSLDIHGLAVLPGPPRTIIASTNQGICSSVDNGETWQDLQVADIFPWRYCRGIMARPDGTLLVGNGSGPPGDGGSIQWTRDLGKSWHAASLPTAPNSTIWHFAANAANASLLFAYSVSGQVFRSIDGGMSWIKLKREFGEIRAMVWTPAE